MKTIQQQEAKEQKPESKKQLLGSVESEEGDRCLREEGGRGPMRQLRAWRVAGPGLKSAPHTNPTRSLCHPPRLLLLSTRAAGGGRRVYRGGGEAAAVSTAAKVTICSGGMVRARLARGETGHREQRDRKSIAGGQHAGTRRIITMQGCPRAGQLSGSED